MAGELGWEELVLSSSPARGLEGVLSPCPDLTPNKYQRCFPKAPVEGMQHLSTFTRVGRRTQAGHRHSFLQESLKAHRVGDEGDAEPSLRDP